MDTKIIQANLDHLAFNLYWELEKVHYHIVRCTEIRLLLKG